MTGSTLANLLTFDAVSFTVKSLAVVGGGVLGGLGFGGLTALLFRVTTTRKLPAKLRWLLTGMGGLVSGWIVALFLFAGGGGLGVGGSGGMDLGGSEDGSGPGTPGERAKEDRPALKELPNPLLSAATELRIEVLGDEPLRQLNPKGGFDAIRSYRIDGEKPAQLRTLTEIKELVKHRLTQEPALKHIEIVLYKDGRKVKRAADLESWLDDLVASRKDTFTYVVNDKVASEGADPLTCSNSGNGTGNEIVLPVSRELRTGRLTRARGEVLMPIHDWTRVDAGIFHAFHHDWITEISRALNRGLLPPDYYALPEQFAGGLGPDVLTLRRPATNGVPPTDEPADGGVALAVAPPKVRIRMQAEANRYAAKAKTVVVRHVSGHHVVAMVEIVSPGNKNNQNGMNAFVSKAREALAAGIHLLLVDLFPPSARDPQGIHRAVWGDDCGAGYALPEDKPLTCVAHVGGTGAEAFVEPIAVEDALPEMPLFLTPAVYVAVPLEATHQSAWEGMPAYWRGVLTTAPAPKGVP